jgi:hypothetical protein
MRLTQRVSFPGGKPYEQYTVEFTIEDTDIPKELVGGCNLLERMFLFNTLVSIEGLLFQYAKGYFSAEDYTAQKDRLISTLSSKLKAVLGELLKVENGKRS